MHFTLLPMRPHLLVLLTAASVLLPSTVLAQNPSPSACRRVLLPYRRILPAFLVPVSFVPVSLQSTEIATAAAAAENLAKSGQGALALQTARAIPEDVSRAQVTLGLIEYLTTDDEFAQTIAILKTMKMKYFLSDFAEAVAERLALKGKLSYAVQALQLTLDQPDSATNVYSTFNTALSRILVALGKKGHSSEALELIQAVPNLDRKDDRIWEVAIALSDIKQLPRSLEVVQMISSNDVKSSALLGITESLTRDGQLYPALGVAQTISTEGERVLGLQAVAGGLLKAGRLDEALQLAQTLEDCEIRAATSIQVARRYREMKQTKQATVILDQTLRSAAVIRFVDLKAQVMTDLASEYGQLGQRQQALSLLAQALRQTQSIQAVPRAVYPSDHPQSTKAELLSRIAKAYRVLGEQKQALQLLAQALKNAQAIKSTFLKGEQLREIASEYKALGRSAKAAELLAQANKLSPPLPQSVPPRIMSPAKVSPPPELSMPLPKR